jgi:hypothetical protein
MRVCVLIQSCLCPVLRFKDEYDEFGRIININCRNVLQLLCTCAMHILRIVNVIYSGATGGSGYGHPSGALEFTHGFQ